MSATVGPDQIARTIERIARHAREKRNQNHSIFLRFATVADVESEIEYQERARIEVEDSTDDAECVRWVVEEIDARLAEMTAELARRRRHREPQHLAPNRYSAELARELKNDVDLPLFMAQYGYSNLRASGDHYFGRCLFHYDQHPSMHVYSDHFHCFVCSAHGDIYDLLRETAGLVWRQALEEVASYLHRPIAEAKR